MNRRNFLRMMGMLGGAVLAESVSRVYSFPSQIVIPNKKVICPSMEEILGIKLSRQGFDLGVRSAYLQSGQI